MDTYTEIKNKIRAMTGQKTPLLLTGKVENVSGETCTVSIGDLTLTDVRLRSVVNGESSKLLITPKKDSYVTLIDLSGDLRETEVIGYSEVEGIDIETSGDININCNGNVTFNGGNNHGMAKVEAVANKLAAIENDINMLKGIFATWGPVPFDGGALLKAATAGWVASSLGITLYTDLENEKIKQ